MLLLIFFVFIGTVYYGHCNNDIRNEEFLENVCPLAGPDLSKDYQKFMSLFDESFNKLDAEMDKYLAGDKSKLLNTVILIGNTGSGKSTLTQLLVGDNSKLYAKEVTPDSGDYIIADDNNIIGSETVVSKTLYPNLILDTETNIFVCDNPGFLDTRSPMHELVAASSIKNVMKNTKNVKFVLVVIHASLKKGSYRSDFTNLMKQVIDFVKDLDKYKDSIYLVATKVENNFILKKGFPILTSDETVIKGIIGFLDEMKTSFQSSMNSTMDNKQLPKMLKLVDILLESTSKIKIFRKPLNDGPLENIMLIQTERMSIRQMLFNNENFTPKEEVDFGYAISDNAKLFINDIYSFADKYMYSISKQISEYLIENSKFEIAKNDDISDKLKYINTNKEKIINLANQIGETKKPIEFVEIIESFFKSKNIKFICNLYFKNVTNLNKHLVNLENFSKSSDDYFLNNKWNSSFKNLIDYITYERDNYNLLDDTFNNLCKYESQTIKNSYLSVLSKWENKDNKTKDVIDNKNFIHFLHILNLDKYNELKPKNETLKILNQIIDLLIKSEMKISCENGILVIKGYIIKLTDIHDYNFEQCPELKSVIIYAMHTIFIDKDLDNKFLKGKQLFIVSPIWDIVGTRKISVDGFSSKSMFMPKADYGKIGKNGENGEDGGVFTGIGLVFENGQNLIISSNGGDGQKGQDGGDGLNGSNGLDGRHYSYDLSDDSKNIYVVYNKYEGRTGYAGTYGQPGGDSGSGGYGGLGGKKGIVKLRVGQEGSGSDVIIKMEDGKEGDKGTNGKPGIGGTGGCDIIKTQTDHYFLFIPVSSNSDVHYGSCRGKNRDGNVLPNLYRPKRIFQWNMITPLKDCELVSNYKNLYNPYSSPLFDKKFNDFSSLLSKSGLDTC